MNKLSNLIIEIPNDEEKNKEQETNQISTDKKSLSK